MNDKGALGYGLTQGNRSYGAAGGLEALTVIGEGNKKILHNGTPIDFGSDGLIAWGRWIDGHSDLNSAEGTGKGQVATLHYFALAGAPSGPVLGNYGSFASTAPTVASGGKLSATGVTNSAAGAVTVAFLTANLGSAAYNLTVPVSGQTFNLVGATTQVSGWGFAGTSLITSTGSGCAGGCTGTLGSGGISVIGLVGGAAGNRLGVNYGFDSRLGNVSGVIVFKR